METGPMIYTKYATDTQLNQTEQSFKSQRFVVIYFLDNNFEYLINKKLYFSIQTVIFISS